MKATSITLITIAALLSTQLRAQWSLVGNAATNSSTNFVGTTDYVDLKVRTNNSVRMVFGKTGNVSVGTVASSLAKFTTSGAIGNTTAIFGTGTSGISLQQSYPGVSFNTYYNGGYKALSTGHGFNLTLDPTNGRLHFRTVGYGASTGSAQTYATAMVITSSRAVGIGNDNPAPAVLLQVGTSTGARMGIGDQTQLIDNGNMRLAISSTFEPTADNVYHLGGSSTRWASVWSGDGSINTSDARDKSNIRESAYGLEAIMKLRPVMFTWKDAPERGEKIGLLAQELQAVIKEAVVSRTITRDEHGSTSATDNARLGVFYSDLVPVAIKAIQEQQKRIDEKDGTIAALQTQLTELEDRLTKMEQMLRSLQAAPATAVAGAHLHQNTPNPFNDRTAIRFYVPGNPTGAEVKIFSSEGKEVKRYRANARGENRIEITAGMLPAGVYNYSLFIDGQLAGTRKMVIAQK